MYSFRSLPHNTNRNLKWYNDAFVLPAMNCINKDMHILFVGSWLKIIIIPKYQKYAKIVGIESVHIRSVPCMFGQNSIVTQRREAPTENNQYIRLNFIS